MRDRDVATSHAISTQTTQKGRLIRARACAAHITSMLIIVRVVATGRGRSLLHLLRSAIDEAQATIIYDKRCGGAIAESSQSSLVAAPHFSINMMANATVQCEHSANWDQCVWGLQ